MEVSFTINGSVYKASSADVPIDTSLNTFIRSHAQLPGTKFMCLEGGCGSCMVTVKRIHPITEKQQIFSVNSCLKSLYSCNGLEIITIEGIDNELDGYHPIQTRLYELNGTQCGYCSPGMVMSMYSLMEGSETRPTMKDVEQSLGGNICRCTGYRPILDAFKSLASDADQKLIDACRDTDLEDMDIEDLSRSCPKTGKACAGICHKPIERPLHFEFVGDKHWYKAIDIKGIFDILDKSGNTPYMLVGGNTAQGIVRISEDVRIFIDISTIPELYRTELLNDEFVIGGSNSLKDSMDLLRKTSKIRGYEYCLDLANHIQLIACDSVRNLGTIGGSLCFKNHHNEFPSDIFLILTTANARLTILETNNLRGQIYVDEFLKYDMNKKVLYNIILPKKVTPPIFKTYKISIRAQNAHAYVNAGFSLDVAGSQIVSARICYGGINPSFVRAKKTENYLVGKNIYTNDVLKEALRSLDSELHPDSELLEASPEYRKNLAMALFYKFVLSTAPPNKITPIHLSGGQLIERPLSSGTQTYHTVEENYPLTQPVQKLEGMIQVTGEAQYINDMPPMKNELWAQFVVATKVHSKIGRIDATEALNIPGVRHFYSAKDIPGANNFTPLIDGVINYNEELFVGVTSEVLFYGQPLGIILADTMKLAIYAAKKVKIIYVDAVQEETSSYLSMARSLLNPLLGANGTANRQIVPTVKEALKYGAIDRFHEIPTNKVATKYGINTTKTIKGRFQAENQFHFSIENQTTICVPADDGMDVHTSSQWLNISQIAIAQCLAIREHKINMVLKRLGGSYGSKIYRSVQIACACALACHLTKRPVRFIMNIEANMTVVGKRFGMISDYTVEIDDVGAIQKLLKDCSQDHGCSLNESPQPLLTIAFLNCYLSDTYTVKYKAVLTDSASNAFCRGPGTLEGIATIENIMEHIAAVTGQDPIDVRLSNMAKDHVMRPMIADFLKDVEYRKRKADCEAFNKVNRWRKRGVSVTLMQWPTSKIFAFQSYVAIYHRDGSVVISHGGVETGQGINTKVAQVAAYILGIPLDYISIKAHNNLISANGEVTGGSTATDMATLATKTACEMLVARMKPIRDAMPADTEWPVLTEACHQQLVDLRATYQFVPSDQETYSIYGVTCSEVEVDILTGNYQLNRVDILEDVGESMNPYVDVGQLEGAFVMGLGYWFSEQLIYSRENGELVTDRSWHYKPPGANDIPVDFRVKFLGNSPNPGAGSLRAKAVGEPAICMSVSALFALRNAVAAARKDAGLPNTWFTFGSATTPEEAFLKTGNSLELFTL